MIQDSSSAEAGASTSDTAHEDSSRSDWLRTLATYQSITVGQDEGPIPSSRGLVYRVTDLHTIVEETTTADVATAAQNAAIREEAIIPHETTSLNATTVHDDAAILQQASANHDEATVHYAASVAEDTVITNDIVDNPPQKTKRSRCAARAKSVLRRTHRIAHGVTTIFCCILDAGPADHEEHDTDAAKTARLCKRYRSV